jgi:hypothetical protein
LTAEYLRELQDQLAQRTTELGIRLEAGLEQMKNEPAPAPGGPGGHGAPGEDPKERERFIEALTAAAPLIEEAGGEFAGALRVFDLAGDEDGVSTVATGALGYQSAGVTKLLEAREYFLDMRGLIELIYSQEVALQQGVNGVEGVTLAMALPTLRETQGKNVERGGRLKLMLADALEAVEQQATPGATPGAAPGGGQVDPSQDPAAAERERLTLATQLLEEATVEMRNASEAFEAWGKSSGAGDEGAAILERARGGVDGSVEKLQALRRLFFSIVEHLRETLGRQVQLNDETSELAGQTDVDLFGQGVGPLVPRQAELRGVAEAIGQALREQSSQNPAGALGHPDAQGGNGTAAQQQQESQAMAERFAQAAEKVEEGVVLMGGAFEKLGVAVNDPAPAPPLAPSVPDIEPVREDQDGAARRLAEALAILEPPQDNEGDQGEQDQQQGQRGRGGGGGQDESGDRDVDTSGLLQSIRDREQQRERDRARRPAGGYEAVEKDW